MKTKKKIVKLTENELKKIISESVKRILKEDFGGKEYGFSQDNWDKPTPAWKRRDYERMEQQMQDYNDEMTNAQIQHSQGKKPRLSQQTRDFLAQDKTVQGKRKESQPTLNKFQKSYQDTARRRDNERVNRENEMALEQERNLLNTVTDDEIEYEIYDLMESQEDSFDYIKSVKIIKQEIEEDEDGIWPILCCDAIVTVGKGEEIDFSAQYESYPYISTIAPNKYKVGVQISARSLKRLRQSISAMAQAEWDEEDRIYGHDNFDDM